MQIIKNNLDNKNNLICFSLLLAIFFCALSLLTGGCQTRAQTGGLTGAGSGDVLAHEVMINADKYTPAGEGLIPTGEIRSVKKTPLDFTEPRTIGARIEKLVETRGYDHNYILNKSGSSPDLASRVYEPTSGRVMEVYTTEPGMQFYTANGMRDIKGKGGRVYQRYHGFCLETQHFPDSPNKSHFPPVVLRPGKEYRTETIFKFSTN